MKPKDVMTIDELAEYLQISKSSLYKLVKGGAVPGHKIGKNWRFHREAIDAWLKDTGAMFPTRDTQFNAAKREARWESLKTQGKANLEKRHASYLNQNYLPNKSWWGSAPQD